MKILRMKTDIGGDVLKARETISYKVQQHLIMNKNDLKFVENKESQINSSNIPLYKSVKLGNKFSFVIQAKYIIM